MGVCGLGIFVGFFLREEGNFSGNEQVRLAGESIIVIFFGVPAFVFLCVLIYNVGFKEFIKSLIGSKNEG